MHTASNLSAGVRVSHANACRSYGAGVITEIVASHVRPPSKARVHFDGEPCPRLVWLDDLTPAPVARVCYPPERAGEPVLPMVSAAAYRADRLRLVEPVVA